MIISAATLLFLTVGGAEAARSLGLSLSGPNTITNVDNFAVVTTVTNTGDEALKLFKDPRTALSPFPENTFSVSSADGTTATFIGALVKYGFNAATDFVSLAPGASIDVTHELSAAYNFTKVGDYTVGVGNLFHHQEADGTASPIKADITNQHTAKLSGSLVSTIVAKRSKTLSKRASFNGCGIPQMAEINTALETTTAYVADSVSYLSSLSSASPRYTTWFGPYSDANKETVLGHFRLVSISPTPQDFNYDCVTCTIPGVFAYVYPEQYWDVFLCPAFWTAPMTGTDSKAGTIVHESTHFKFNGGTQDYAYGHEACKVLAVEHTDQAIMNADSHEFFAENTPAEA